jgi:hypothetical protein
MAVVIHTRKGKYHYAYEHTREGDKVVSRYMYPVNDRGDKIKQYQKGVAQHSEQKDEQYYNKEVYEADQRQRKQWEEDDIKSGAVERQKKAQAILDNTNNYDKEFGVEKDGKLIKEGCTTKLDAMDYAKDHHYKTSTYDRKAEHLEHYSKAGYEVVFTKRELKPEYKKEIIKLLGKKVK